MGLIKNEKVITEDKINEHPTVNFMNVSVMDGLSSFVATDFLSLSGQAQIPMKKINENHQSTDLFSPELR